MAYVDGYFDRQRDVLRVVERIDGRREYKEFPARYQFYYPDPRGKFTSIFGDSLERVVCNTSKKFNTEKKIHGHKKLFESDLNPLFRCFAENYDATDTPELQTAFFDIETDFNQEKGFAPPEDPFNAVTAVSVHLSWLNRTICLAIKPDTLTKEQATEV